MKDVRRRLNRKLNRRLMRNLQRSKLLLNEQIKMI
jgi:hypothetical protein